MAIEIGSWLEEHGLGQFADLFAENEIDLDAAADLTEDDLRELGIAMGPRKKLMRAIAELAPATHERPAGALPDRVQDATAAAQLAGERRQVTVLFADICGYTQLSGELGAEGTYSLLETYFRTVDTIVKSYGGNVDKHIGDSVMAVFGAPVSHSDDPERAIRAALAIHQAMPKVSEEAGCPVNVHIGIASGQVVASQIGTENHYTVTGDSVNLASRLTDQAGADQTFLSANVQRSLGPDCQAEDLGEFNLKGIPEPVRVFRLLSLDRAAGDQFNRPFVGRQPELRQFSAALRACVETGSGQAVYLRGEAGIGKTRLTEEFERLALELDFRAHRALVLDFGAGEGQDAIRSLVRSLLSLSSQSGIPERSAAAVAAIDAGLIASEQSAFLYDLLGLDQLRDVRALYDAMDNVTRNRGKREAVAALVSNLARSHRLLLIVEDVHWANALVLEHLAELTRAVADLTVLLVMTSRIEGDQLDESWRASTSSTPIVTVDLRPLRREDALTLASEFFDATNQFAISCVERADGNPLFLEQLLRGAESAADENVPGSVQSLVQARMDMLDPPDRHALQAASVLGQRFSIDALRAVTDSSQYDCGNLIRRYLVRPSGEAFLFAHALVRDGVYNSLLVSNRKELHRRAADWYRSHDPALCAEHLDRADDPGAAEAYLNAGRAQAEALRFEAVSVLTRRGMALSTDDALLCDLACLLADALLNMGATNEAMGAFREAIAHAADDIQRCAAWTGLASALRMADRQNEALQALDKAEEAARNNSLTPELAHIHYLRGNLYFPLGRIDECLSEHEVSYRLAREVGSLEAEARALSGLGDAHYLQGRMITAFESFNKCVRLAQEQGFGRIEVANRQMVGWSRIHLMEFREALDDARNAVKLAARVSHNRAEVGSYLLAGTILSEMGDQEAAVDHLEKSRALAEKMGAGNFISQVLWRLSRVRLARGHVEEASDLVQQALETAREFSMTFVGPAVLATWASLAPDSESRRKALDEAEAIMDSGCVGHNYPWFAEIAIDDALARHEWDYAERCARRLDEYTAHQSLPWADFMVRRAQVLVAWHRDGPSAERRAQIESLAGQAETAGLNSPLPALRDALRH